MCWFESWYLSPNLSSSLCFLIFSNILTASGKRRLLSSNFHQVQENMVFKWRFYVLDLTNVHFGLNNCFLLVNIPFLSLAFSISMQLMILRRVLIVARCFVSSFFDKYAINDKSGNLFINSVFLGNGNCFHKRSSQTL